MDDIADMGRSFRTSIARAREAGYDRLAEELLDMGHTADDRERLNEPVDAQKSLMNYRLWRGNIRGLLRPVRVREEAADYNANLGKILTQRKIQVGLNRRSNE